MALWCCTTHFGSHLQACRDRWRALKSASKRVTGKWSVEEDSRLKELVEEYQQGRQQEPVRSSNPDPDLCCDPATDAIMSVSVPIMSDILATARQGRRVEISNLGVFTPYLASYKRLSRLLITT